MDSSPATLQSLLSAPRPWLPELKLASYLLSPRKVREGERLLELNGWRIPQSLFLGPLVMFAVGPWGGMIGKGGRASIGHIAFATILIFGAGLSVLALSFLTRIRIVFDGSQRSVRVDRWCLGLWSRSQTFAFEAISALDPFAFERMNRYCLVLSSASGRQAILGRFPPSKALGDLRWELNALVFGEDELTRALRAGGLAAR